MFEQRKSFLRTCLLGSTASVVAVAAMGISGTAVAQDDAIKTVIVTGSRIARAEISSTSPLTVVEAEEFRLSGAVNVEELLNTLPQTIPGFDSSSNDAGDGTAFINLRGLGPNRNLILVNGRRVVPSGLDGIVDVNNIPSALVERVEIVTGGASAVYGSDAMTGVVNFILKDDFEGIEVDYQYKVSHKGDGDIHSISAAWGSNFADDRGNVTVFANYWKRQPVFRGDRKFSTFPLTDGFIAPGSTDPEFFFGTPLSFASGGVPGFIESGSVGILGTGLQVLEGGIDTAISALCPTTNFLCRFDSAGNVIDFNAPDDRFNFAPDRFLQINGERLAFTVNANYEVNQYFNLYTELHFIDNEIDTESDPTPVFTTLSLDVDSPFFSADTQTKFAALDNGVSFCCGSDGFLTAFISGRFPAVGPRQSLNEREAYRFVVGFDGTLENGWRYDAYYSYGRISRQERQEGGIFLARFVNAVNTVPDGAGGIQCSGTDPDCIPINIFGEGNLDEAMAASIGFPVTNFTRNTEQVASISLTGDAFDLGAGPVGFAAGFEYRSEFANFRPDTALTSGPHGSTQVFGFRVIQPLEGKFEVWEVYAEVVVPLLSDVPAIKNLEVTGAARLSDYTTAGTLGTYAAGLNWDVVDGFRVRAGYQRAVRAPSMSELFEEQLMNFPGAQDPCATGPFQSLEGANPNLAQACIDNGVPAPAVGVFVQPNSQIPTLIGGNPNLAEETADTYTIGFVAQPSFLPGLHITLDYYNIKISDVIGPLESFNQAALNNCLLLLEGDPSNPLCQAIARDASGAVQLIDLTNANPGVLSTEGLDLQISYNVELSEFGLGRNLGNLGIFFLGTHVIDNRSIATEFSDPLRCDGNFGEGFSAFSCGQPDPQWRSNTRVTWSKGPVSISSRWRYIGATNQSGIENRDLDPALLARPRIDAKHYFDLSFTFQFNEHFTIFGGIDNVFNNLPPILGSDQEQSNTFPSTYPTLGSRFFMGGTANF